MRVEKVVKIIEDRAPSMKYPSYGWSFTFKDEDGNKYEWDTMSIPDNSIMSGQTWLIRMTLGSKKEVIGYRYIEVTRVFFVKRLN